MKKTFIETHGFTQRLGNFFDDDAYAAFQQLLMEKPEIGSVIPGCGGLRKVRVGNPRRQRGKRGGVRVVYLHVPEANWILLVDIYGKDEKDDLSRSEKTALRRLAKEFKAYAARAAERGSEDQWKGSRR